MMMKRWLMAFVAGTLLYAPGLAQRVGYTRPIVKVTPAPWLPTPQLAPNVLPTVLHFNPPASDFFPAAPTVLVDNTTFTGFYFSFSNIILDDANIPNTLDTDGNDTYYLTSINLAVYVPSTAQQPVQIEVYLAGNDAGGNPDPNDLASPIDTFEGTLSPGVYILTVNFPRCNPAEQDTLQFTSTGGNAYDYFWIGMKFPQYCVPGSTGGPGWVMASGPGYENDFFYWQGNASCGGTIGAGYYYFGGNPRASFYMKVMGAATFAEAVTTNPNVTGDTPCVDDADLLAVLFQFGWTGTPGGTPEDTDCSGVVDDADLLNVLFAFGSGC
jgi:hypothetical protein